MREVVDGASNFLFSNTNITLTSKSDFYTKTKEESIISFLEKYYKKIKEYAETAKVSIEDALKSLENIQQNRDSRNHF